MPASAGHDVPSNADADLIFGSDIEEKYLRALRKIGIDPGMLSTDAGHA